MKQTFTYWIYVKARGSQLAYELSDLQWSNDTLAQTGRVLIGGERTLTLELPELNQAMPLVVASLEAKKKQMRAVAEAAVNEVDAQIQSLLALEAPAPNADPLGFMHAVQDFLGRELSESEGDSVIEMAQEGETDVQHAADLMMSAEDYARVYGKEAPMCDSCHDNYTIDCHDCEQHQHAIEDGWL